MVDPISDKIRFCVENKSVVTAHRNLYARFDDLNEALQVLHQVRSEAVLIATVIVGVADRVLNVPDKVKPLYKNKPADFQKKILPRLSSGDQKLWKDFDWAISFNRPGDSANTVKQVSPASNSSAGTYPRCRIRLYHTGSRLHRQRQRTLHSWARRPAQSRYRRGEAVPDDAGDYLQGIYGPLASLSCSVRNGGRL